MKDRAQFILEAFRELGVPMKAGSRLDKQIDFFLDRKGKLPNYIEPEHPFHKIGVEASRDLNQIAYALGHLLHVVSDADLRLQLDRIMADSVLPQDSRENSRGRDAQLELYVAGLCAHGGLSPVFDESPDIRCTLGDVEYGVAVKRIKSARENFEARFKERIREAADQIAKSQLPGIIVTDISHSRNPDNWWVPIEWSDVKFDVQWKLSNERFKNHFAQRLLDWTKGTKVRGVIVLDHILRCTPAKRWQVELFGSSFCSSPFNQRRRREFKRFDDRFMGAILRPDAGPAFKALSRT